MNELIASRTMIVFDEVGSDRRHSEPLGLDGPLPTKPALDTKVAGNDVYLVVHNGSRLCRLTIEVESVTGVTDDLPTPFFLPWVASGRGECVLQPDQKQLLHFVRVEPKGNEDEYPIDDGNPKRSIRQRLLHWRPGRFRFFSVSAEYAVYLELGAAEVGTAFAATRRYDRRLQVYVRMRSPGGSVDETRIIELGLNRDDTPFVAVNPMPLTAGGAGWGARPS